MSDGEVAIVGHHSRVGLLSQARLPTCFVGPPSTVGLIHHCGCACRKARAAAAAARCVSNKAKQVAPEPDMRARRQPGRARNAASAHAMIG